MKTSILILILSFSLLNPQEENSLVSPFPNSNFIPLPLKVGNAWTYRQTVSGKTTYNTYWIADSVLLNSQRVYLLNNEWLFDYNGAYYSEGILYGMNIIDPVNSVQAVFPKDPVVGQAWETGVERICKLEAVDDTVTIPAGTFSAYRISFTRVTSVYILWWANGIGLIKISGGDENSELISFFTE